MKSKPVFYFPIALFAFGFIWATQTAYNRPIAYHFGMALGFNLIPAIPALIFAWIHYLAVRGKNKSIQEENAGILDAEVKLAKKDFWHYFFNYLAVIGLLVCLIIVLRRSGVF